MIDLCIDNACRRKNQQIILFWTRDHNRIFQNMTDKELNVISTFLAPITGLLREKANPIERGVLVQVNRDGQMSNLSMLSTHTFQSRVLYVVAASLCNFLILIDKLLNV